MEMFVVGQLPRLYVPIHLHTPSPNNHPIMYHAPASSHIRDEVLRDRERLTREEDNWRVTVSATFASVENIVQSRLATSQGRSPSFKLELTRDFSARESAANRLLSAP